MRQILLEQLIAIIILIVGLTSGIGFILNEDKTLFWLLSIALVCIALSILIFIHVRKHRSQNETETTLQNDPSIVTLGLRSNLEKQNAIIAQWRKTANLRDQLKLLKISSQKKIESS